MSRWVFLLVLIGTGTVTSWLFRVIDLIEAPAKRRR